MSTMRGYTLLELAIVLMVLALLLGGFLKWQAADDAPPQQTVHAPK